MTHRNVQRRIACLFSLLLANTSVGRAGCPDFASARIIPTFQHGLSTRSMAVADLDGDNRLDVVTTGFTDVRVLLGTSDGTFAVPTVYDGGMNPVGIIVEDFNRDGLKDLAWVNEYYATVSVRLGTGRGAFGNTAQFSMSGYALSLAAADLDSDGSLDLVVGGSGGEVAILVGRGDGTFAPAVRFDATTFSRALALADLNRDGNLDVVVADPTRHHVAILLGNGKATFAAAKSVPTDTGYDTGAFALAVSDFDGDRNPDLAVANVGLRSVTVLRGLGDGTFSEGVNYGTGSGPMAVVADDLDGDGKSDIAVANNWSSTITFLRNRGDGQFHEGINYVAPTPSTIAVADVNGDGRRDLVASGYSGVTALLATDSGAFDAARTYSVGFGPQGMAVGDFNRDDNLDLAVTNGYSDSVSILLGRGDGTFVYVGHSLVGLFPWGITVNDFNGDGLQDLAVTNAATISSSVSVLIGDGNGSFTVGGEYKVRRNPTSIVSDDFNDDGNQDLAVTSASDNDFSILLGDGSGKFAREVSYYSGGNDTWSISKGDFNRDGNIDLVTTNSRPTVVTKFSNVSVHFGRGDGTFAQGVSYPAGREPRGLAVGDLNADGNADLAVANTVSGDVSVFLGTPTGVFLPPTNAASGSEPVFVVADDFTGDGMADLAVINASSYGEHVTMFRSLFGRLSAPLRFPSTQTPIAAAAGDFNGDGRSDLAVANQGTNDVAILLNSSECHPRRRVIRH